MFRRTSRSALVALAAASLALAGCGGEDAEEPDDAAQLGAEGGVELVNEGALTVCTHLPYPPFEFAEGDEVVGFDIALMQELASDLGLDPSDPEQFQVLNTPFEGIQSGEDLNARSCDIAAAGMTITPERQEAIAFSDPYFDATQALITEAGSGYDSLESLEGQTLGVQQGTTGEIYAQENAPEGVELRVYEDLQLLLTAVQTGQVAAAINDNGVLYDYVQDNPDLEVTTEFDTGEQYGFGIRLDNEPLVEQTNETLARLQEDGTYAEIYEEWFGTAPGGADASPSPASS